MCAPIWLKFEKHSSWESKSIKFWVHLIKIQGVTGDFTHKKSNFCHAYRVNEEQAENQYVDSLNIRGVTFGGYRINQVRDN